jgi:hypothetical protein
MEAGFYEGRGVADVVEPRRLDEQLPLGGVVEPITDPLCLCRDGPDVGEPSRQSGQNVGHDQCRRSSRWLGAHEDTGMGWERDGRSRREK